VGPQVQQGKHELDGDETHPEDHHQDRQLPGLYLLNDGALRRTYSSVIAEQLVRNQHEEELQGIHVEKHDEQQDGAQAMV
jgi:hypothetical protein